MLAQILQEQSAAEVAAVFWLFVLGSTADADARAFAEGQFFEARGRSIALQEHARLLRSSVC